MPNIVPTDQRFSWALVVSLAGHLVLFHGYDKAQHFLDKDKPPLLKSPVVVYRTQPVVQPKSVPKSVPKPESEPKPSVPVLPQTDSVSPQPSLLPHTESVAVTQTKKPVDNKATEREYNVILNGIMDENKAGFLSYFDKIKYRIMVHSFYPDGARKRDARGKVSVAFRVSHEGKLLGLWIDRPAASALLNRNALSAIKVAAPFSKFPPAIQREALDFVVTLVYRLYA